MLFSLLMANYNNSGYLDDAIKSVLAQTHDDWELIIVDDASTDGFGEAIGPWLQEPRIKVFRNDRNYGCGTTKRRCAAEASGELLAFVDPDDALTPDALSRMTEAHLARPECSLIHSTHFICDEKLVVGRIADYPRAIPPGTPYLLLNDGRVHHFASFKRSCYERTAGISPENKRAVDQDLYYKLEETGAIHFINIPLYYYRIHPNSISNSGKELATQMDHYRIIEEACRRRMGSTQPATRLSRRLYKRYRTHYFKIRLFHSFREKRWLPFIANFFAFSFTRDGMANLFSYIRKLPLQGTVLFRRSFVDTYQIKA
jgi:glycosyltransferase involved in cell wall biosynthesis